MLNKSYHIIVIGILSMIVSSIFFYFDSKSMAGFILFGGGFIVVGIGLLMGLFKMMSDK